VDGQEGLSFFIFVRFQGIIEYELKVGGRCRRRVSARHEGGSWGFIRSHWDSLSIEETTSCVVGDGVEGNH